MNNDSCNKNTRREFVKDTSMIAGGLLAMPLLSKANFFSGADDVIKVAVVGCGGRGTGAAIQALSSKQNVKIVAMADAFKDNVDNCYKALVDEINNGIGEVNKRLDVPEERRFFGFDAYQKALLTITQCRSATAGNVDKLCGTVPTTKDFGIVK